MKPINNTTIPGIRPGADYSILTSDEIEICKKLSGRYWYLTRFNQRKLLVVISRARPSGFGSQLRGFTDLLPTNWFPMVLVCLPVIAIYQTPIFVRMTSDD